MLVIHGAELLQCPGSPTSTWPLGGGGSVGLIVTSHGDAALAAARLAPPADLWSGQSQQTVS